jgi:hypothetical protein
MLPFPRQVAARPDDMALTSRGYFPFLVCSTNPDLSGWEREEQLKSFFQNAPGVNASHYYGYGENTMFHNDDDMSCTVTRAFKDAIRNVYASHPYGTNYMTITSIHSSMKMSKNTVEVMQTWFKEGSSTDVITTQATGSENTMQVKAMGLMMLLCPGVQTFAGEDTFDDLIASDIKMFVTENGGETVESLSFYNHRVSGLDGGDAIHTGRMEKWSSAVTTVMGWTKDDGSNICLDVIINENTVFSVEDIVLQVKMKISFREVQTLGVLEDEMEICVWYLTYALALSPQICSLEPETIVKTLCSDGSSDLSKCPSPPDPPESSSSKIWLGSWKNYGVSLIALLATL